jgi:hypothetical protein
MAEADASANTCCYASPLGKLCDLFHSSHVVPVEMSGASPRNRLLGLPLHLG